MCCLLVVQHSPLAWSPLPLGEDQRLVETSSLHQSVALTGGGWSVTHLLGLLRNR
jgi:hypothetical protein